MTEVVVQSSKNAPLELLLKEHTPRNSYATWETLRSKLPNEEKLLQWKHDFSDVQDFLSKLPRVSILTPLYLKKPNITLSNRTHDSE